jgi:hypothetical protein
LGLSGEPSDLIPLPTMPYNVRPVELPLDIEECRTAIWRCKGNVSRAAELLKVPATRLRHFIKRSPYLERELRESLEQLADRAEEIVDEALNDEEDKGRRDQMARFVLGSQVARARGWGNGQAQPGMKINNTNGGVIVVQWEDGTKFDGKPQAEGPVIDHESD